MKILLFGKNGQVGWELNRELLSVGEVMAVDYPEADFSNPDIPAALVRDHRPNVIVNAAAFTAVDRAEDDEDLAFRINAQTPAALAEEARKLNAFFVHYSTDYVFDGTKKEAYTEADMPNPLNAYGRTKLAGDVAIRESGCRHLILRTSWVFGARGQNFLLTMLKLARERAELRIVDDQTGVPTWSRMIAQTTSIVVRKLSRQGVTSTEFQGVYNLTSGSSVSWFTFAKEIIEGGRRRGLLPNSDVPKLSAIKTDEYLAKAVRPMTSILSTEKLKKDFAVHMPAWDVCVGLVLDELALANKQSQTV